MEGYKREWWYFTGGLYSFDAPVWLFDCRLAFGSQGVP